MLQWINRSYSKIQKTAILGGLLFVAVFCFYFAFAGALPAFSQTTMSQADPGSELLTGIQIIEEPIGLPATDIRLIIANIIRIALGLIGIVLLVIIIYAGFLWMTAAGNEEQIDKAKKTLTNAVIGLAIILSAYAIVLFVMRMLGISFDGTMMPSAIQPGTQNFRGSGALGRIIKDHYPNRNQINVPRNTKIVITFFHPIQMNNLAVDTNNNGIIGDCNEPYDGWSWETDCDQMIFDNNLINISAVIPSEEPGQAPTLEPIRGAAILASRSVDPATQIEGVYTIVIRPLDYLGSSLEDVSYLIRLGNDIRRDDAVLGNPRIFDGISGSKYYEWQFTCGTELDLSPPYVIDVYPGVDTVEFKNTVIQISFNEPMDPIGVQGIFAESQQGYYFLQNGFIYLKNNQSTMPLGGFNLVNNYQTLEFTPFTPCGVNACGGTVYCMPVCDAPGADCSQDDYEILLKAATTISTDLFESFPFTGVADISGNALDGNNDGVVDVGPTAGPVFVSEGTGWKAPDHYWWGFGIKDEMDLIPPIISQVIPGPQAPWVSANEDWSTWFDKRMRIDPMYYIEIDETPTPQERCVYYGYSGNQCILDLIWKVPFVSFSTTTPITRTKMNHGPFLDGLPQGYIPYLDSKIEDARFNCLYPGQGPLSAEPYGDDKTSGYCDKEPQNCCIVNDALVFCCNGDPFMNDPSACKSNLQIQLGNPVK